MLYQITYELKATDKDYAPLYLAIKRMGEWFHPLETVWFVVSQLSLEDVSKTLSAYVDARYDKILVTTVSHNGMGGRASTEFWKWLKNNYVT